jgi:hypothetical protein
MNLNPPNGSKISVTTDGPDPVIVVLYGSAGPMRYLIGLFLLFWLGAWYAGFSTAISTVLAGKANAFLLFWLGGWTLGGIMAAIALYRVFRPSIPETLRLMSNALKYDSGVPPFKMSSGSMNQKDQWRSFFPKRTRMEIDRRQLQSLRLRETNAGNRLTVDAEALRLDIAQSASEIEREWLYQFLAKRYSLPSAAAYP